MLVEQILVFLTKLVIVSQAVHVIADTTQFTELANCTVCSYMSPSIAHYSCAGRADLSLPYKGCL